METPEAILERLFARATAVSNMPLLTDAEIIARADLVCHTGRNRAGTRLLMACLLATIHHRGVDPRKPYAEIGGADSFSGRHYDESYVEPFIRRYRLPCNVTTAFLTPAFRNMTRPLTPDVPIAGRPREMYVATLQLLEDVQVRKVAAEDLLTYLLRCLIAMRDEQQARLAARLEEARRRPSSLSLSSEEITEIIEKHLAERHSSRLPVLLITAAYQAAQPALGEVARTLRAHNAADSQTGALGDVEVTLANEARVSYLL